MALEVPKQKEVEFWDAKIKVTDNRKQQQLQQQAGVQSWVEKDRSGIQNGALQPLHTNGCKNCG